MTEDGAFSLFFRPHPGGFDSSRVPTPGNLPSKAKKMLMPGGQPGGVLGAGGIDWCITNDFLAQKEFAPKLEEKPSSQLTAPGTDWNILR